MAQISIAAGKLLDMCAVAKRVADEREAQRQGSYQSTAFSQPMFPSHAKELVQEAERVAQDAIALVGIEHAHVCLSGRENEALRWLLQPGTGS